MNAILGGVGDIVREKMRSEGIYDEFISVLQVSRSTSLLIISSENSLGGVFD